MTLGQRIQKGRKEAGLSQEELAEQLGVSRQAVSRWENDNGYPEMEKIIRLSQIYQVSLDYLVGNEQEKPGEDISEKGWYVSNELAESFLAHQKSKFIKIGICFLLACVSSVFSYMNMYNNVGDVISTFKSLAGIVQVQTFPSICFTNSSVVPTSIIFPSFIIAFRVAIYSMSETMCVEISTIRS